MMVRCYHFLHETINQMPCRNRPLLAYCNGNISVVSSAFGPIIRWCSKARERHEYCSSVAAQSRITAVRPAFARWFLLFFLLLLFHSTDTVIIIIVNLHLKCAFSSGIWTWWKTEQFWAFLHIVLIGIYIYMLRVMIVRDSCLTESQGPYHLFDPDHFISIHFSFKGGEKLGNEIKSCLSYTITSRRCAVMIGVEPDGSKQKDFL